MTRDPASGRDGSGSVSTAFLGRLADRARLRRWNRTKVVAVVLLGALLLGALAWVVLGSSLLAVRTVEVRGVDPALAAKVRVVAEDVAGTPLARVDVGELERRVGGVRGVREVEVSRRWPRTIRVEVEARTPFASTSSPEGIVVLDETGAVLATRSRAPAALPRVVVGDGPGATLLDGLTVLASTPATVRGRVERVEVRSAQDIRLELRNGDVVRWGSTADGARKAAVLTALLGQPASVYDVSAPGLPTTRE